MSGLLKLSASLLPRNLSGTATLVRELDDIGVLDVPYIELGMKLYCNFVSGLSGRGERFLQKKIEPRKKREGSLFHRGTKLGEVRSVSVHLASRGLEPRRYLWPPGLESRRYLAPSYKNSHLTFPIDRDAG